MSNFTVQPICDTLETNYMPYAMSVIVSRAIPEIDGFKPSHRKLLYTMYKMGLLGANRTKSANVVGQTMKLNPHGESAIYETMVRLARGNEALLHPLVDSKGNFGKQYSKNMAYAASRYTEVKLDKICEEIFADIDKDTVDFCDNYDGTMKEPSLLPTTFPNILINPNQGIAVGMASNICSFNLNEVCAATVALLKNHNADVHEHIKAPDFSTGGEIIYNEADMQEILNSGKGSIRVRAKYSFDKANSCIEITEIPYTTTVEAIMDKVIEAIKGGKTKEITDIRDETDLSGLKITIDVKKNTDIDALMAKLYKLTPLEDSFGCNFNILIGGKPEVLGVRKILLEWCDFRRVCVKRSIAYDIKVKSEKLHLYNGLKAVLLDIDKAIEIVRNTQEEKEVVPNLISYFKIDEVQAEFVAEIKLRNINREFILRKIDETDKLRDEIAQLKDILEQDKEINKLIIKGLLDVSKKFGKERKTSIVEKSDITEAKVEHFVEDYNLKLFLTKENYVKKISLVSLRAYSEHKLKDGDKIVCEEEASNKDEVLFFGDKGNVYKMKIHEIPDHKASAFGEYCANFLPMEDGEKIIYMTPVTDYKGYLVIAFRNGKMAKIEMQAYETKTNRKKLINAFNIKSPVVDMVYIKEDTLIVLKSGGGRIITMSTELIAPKSTRATQGVQVYSSKRDKELWNMELYEKSFVLEKDNYKIRKIPSSGAKPNELVIDGEQLQLLFEEEK